MDPDILVSSHTSWLIKWHCMVLFTRPMEEDQL